MSVAGKLEAIAAKVFLEHPTVNDVWILGRFGGLYGGVVRCQEPGCRDTAVYTIGSGVTEIRERKELRCPFKPTKSSARVTKAPS